MRESDNVWCKKCQKDVLRYIGPETMGPVVMHTEGEIISSGSRPREWHKIVCPECGGYILDELNRIHMNHSHRVEPETTEEGIKMSKYLIAVIALVLVGILASMSGCKGLQGQEGVEVVRITEAETEGVAKILRGKLKTYMITLSDAFLAKAGEINIRYNKDDSTMEVDIGKPETEPVLSANTVDGFDE